MITANTMAIVFGICTGGLLATAFILALISIRYLSQKGDKHG